MNVSVGSDGVPRIGGLGSAFIQSFPDAWAEEPTELTRCSAPELVNPEALSLAKAQTTKSSDMYAFGVLAYEVNHVLWHCVFTSDLNLCWARRFLRVSACSLT
jgi:hypothetical protein